MRTIGGLSQVHGVLVVYVDNDPMVLAHSRALLVGVTAPTAYVDADLRDTGKVLAEAARLLDFRKPVAVMLISVLRLIPEEDDPYAIVTRLMEAVPSGSWLALSHPARDVHPQQVTEAASRFNQLALAKATLRTRAEILRLFDGLELLEPGLVQVHQWRPGLAPPDAVPAQDQRPAGKAADRPRAARRGSRYRVEQAAPRRRAGHPRPRPAVPAQDQRLHRIRAANGARIPG